MKTVQILCIAIMLCLANCANLGGRSFVATYSNEDPGSCLLNLTYVVASNKVTFQATKYLPDPGNPDCTFQDVVSAPMWYNVPFTPVNLNFSDPSLTGIWQYSDFNQAKGKSCFLIGDFGAPAQQQWACRFKYSSIYFYLNVRLAASNTSFDTSHTNLLFPELSAKNTTRFGFTIWVPNNAFPHIIGKLEDGCGVNNWDNVINNLNTDVTVTGTEYMSNTFDLNTYLSGTVFLAAFALKSGVNAANYRRIQVAGSPMPFQSPSAQQCTDMGINYNTGSLIPNLNYCDPGCSISFMLRKNPQQYLIITNGIHTPVRLLRA